jgi:hypothetical protein
MKGDFTRDSFRPTQDYNRVLLQQGRVPLDADWNEAQAIDRYLERTGLADVIGQSGVPYGDSFKVTLGADGQLHLGKGHLYVDGILVENRADDYVIPNSATYLGGSYFLYLDVTERHITALEDPEIREKALGGVDTATRVKTTWKVAALDNGDGNPTCASGFSNIPPATSARLAARARRPDDVEACTVTPGSRYRRLENQLYRVEVHTSGDLTTATFKWSRDNGTVAATASVDTDRRISVSDIGRDAFLTFQTGGWIELVDDTRDASDTPGDFFFVSRIEGNVLILAPNRPGAVAADYGPGLRARRWDSIHDVPFTDDDGGYMRLEDGIQVQITGSDFRSGDYWLIPARTIDSDVWWPQDGGNPAALPPHGIVHHYAPLAIAKFNGTVTDITDCRNEFVPLNHIKSLFYLGGDGQSFVQSSSPIPVVTKPTVGVSRGEVPVKDALVRWTVLNGIGTVSGSTEVVTVTDEFGVTSADWILEGNAPSQSLTAQLLDSSLNPTHLPITFTASVNPAPSGGGCSHTVGERGEFPTIQDAISQLVEKGERDISLCLLPGDHLIDGLKVGNPKTGSKLNSLSIHGHLGGSKVRSTGPWAISWLKAFVLKDVYLTIEGGQFGIATVGCYEVRYENCTILGIMETPLQPIIESAFVMDFLLRDSSILFATKKREEAPAPTDNPGFNNNGFVRPAATFSNIQFSENVTKRFPTDVQPLTAEGVKLSEFAETFERMDTDGKRFKGKQTANFLAEHRMEMSPDKQATLGQLAHELVQDQPDTEVIATLSARLQADEEVQYDLGLGVAVTFNDAIGTQRVEDNTIVGFVTTYGATSIHRLDANNIGTISEIWEEFPSLVLKPGGVFHFHNNECYGLLVGDRIADYTSDFWKEMRQNEPPTTPDPVYVNAHISDNSFIFLGIEFFGSLITLESNSFFTFLPGDGHFALAILGYRATLSGNLSFVPQYKRLVCVPTCWGDYWNPGWVEAATLNLY